MTKSKREEYVARDIILELLSDEEVARISKAEAGARLSEGEEYIDLELLPRGVQQADGVAIVMGRVLPKKAVRATTWTRILMQLTAAGILTPRAQA